jgi:NADPH:quinone reductase-like Zn-dependent oxidoreductase
MLMKLPEQFSLEQGAAFPVIYITAFMMMCDLGNLKKNEYVFIRGAGGGVGTAAIQIAKALGAKIIGASSSWKHEKMQKLGADFCIDYRNENVKEKVLDFTKGYGVDLIIDPVGAKQWRESYEILAPMGKLIVYGNQNLVTGSKKSLKAMFNEFITMPKIKPYQMIGSNKAIMGYHLGRLKGAEHKIGFAIEGLYKLANQGLISPIIAKIFPYNESPSAHKYIQDRKNFGKVLIDFTNI